MRRRFALVLVAPVVLLAGCAGEEADLAGIVASYFVAVQSGDDSRVVALSAGCPAPADCKAELARIRAEVQAQREAGAYAFDDRWGLGLATALVLGRGGYYEIGETRREGDVTVVPLRVRTHYSQNETIGLPANAVIEYLVQPLGTVRRIARRERGGSGLRQQLAQVDLELRLRAGGEGWLVDSLRVLPETAVFEEVTWRPR